VESVQRSLRIFFEWSNINYCCNETEVAWICGVFFVRLRTTTTAVDSKCLLAQGEDCRVLPFYYGSVEDSTVHSVTRGKFWRFIDTG
jgi:hypothetical protein